jgi:hypothetical protein
VDAYLYPIYSGILVLLLAISGGLTLCYLSRVLSAASDRPVAG